MEQPVYIPPEEAPPARSGRGRSIGAGFMYFGMYIAINSLVSVLYAIIIVSISFAQTGGLDYYALIQQVLDGSALLAGICGILTLVVYWIFFAARRCHFGEETRLRRVNFPALLLMIPLGLCCYVFVVCILSLLPQSALSGYADSAEGLLGSTSLLTILCIAVIAPLAEEVIFRGLLYTRLKRGMGRALALPLTSLIFGVMHGQLVWAAYAFALSLLLCLVLDWYDSLWASVLLHLSFNAGQYLLPPFLEPLSVEILLLASVLLLIPLILLAHRVGKRAQR